MSRIGNKPVALPDGVEVRVDGSIEYSGTPVTSFVSRVLSEGIHELQVSDGVAQFFRPQRTDHFIAGFEWVGLPEWEIRAEVYEKQYRNTRQRFENLFRICFQKFT